MIHVEDLHAPVPGAPGYWCSAAGQVLSIRRRRNRFGPARKHGVVEIRARADTSLDHRTGRPRAGYFKLDLYIAGRKVTHRRCQVVALAWLGVCPPGRVVCHSNGVCADDRASNLYYGTYLENNLDTAWHTAGNRGTPRPRGDAEDPTTYAEVTEADSVLLEAGFDSALGF